MKNPLVIDGHSLRIKDVVQVAKAHRPVVLHRDALTTLNRVRAAVEQLLQEKKPFYGINTGFGALAEKSIPQSDLKKLQHHLILSHAVGIGEPLSINSARALMLLRANALASGFSGCRGKIPEHLLTLLNAGCAPYVPCKGSVGASGDLAPLAHLGLLLLGIGDAFVQGKLVSAKKALQHAGLSPLILEAKEGLSLINGTQAMAAVGCLAVNDAEQLCLLADIIGACSLEALMGIDIPFDPRIHKARPHAGQAASAKLLRAMLEGSQIRKQNIQCNKVQDAYSLRCMPQVHGASRGAVAHVQDILACEINSATDNPLVFERKHGIDVLSGGNFHGQPLALALDYLAIATSELANISERRMEQMLNPNLSCGLPPFLAPQAGINSGFMIMQVAAASLVNENKVLSHPASTDSIPTSANREDHVSMGMTSANKAAQIVENTYIVLATELLMACQGIDLRTPAKPSKRVRRVVELVRAEIPFAPEDRLFSVDLKKAIALCKSGVLT